MQTEFPHPLPYAYTYLSHRALRGTVLAYPDINDPLPVSVDLTVKYTGKNSDQTDIWLTKTISTSIARHLTFQNLTPSYPDEYRLHFYNLRPCQRRGNWQFELFLEDFEWDLDATHKIDANGVDITTYAPPPHVFTGGVHMHGLYKSGSQIWPGPTSPRATKADPDCVIQFSTFAFDPPYHSVPPFDVDLDVADPTTWRTDTSAAWSGTLSVPDIDTDLDATLDYDITLTLQ